MSGVTQENYETFLSIVQTCSMPVLIHGNDLSPNISRSPKYSLYSTHLQRTFELSPLVRNSEFPLFWSDDDTFQVLV